MKTEIKNISGIDFEENSDEEKFSKDLRCVVRTPINFNQQQLTDFYGDLLEKENIKILEIGCGWR